MTTDWFSASGAAAVAMVLADMQARIVMAFVAAVFLADVQPRVAMAIVAAMVLTKM